MESASYDISSKSRNTENSCSPHRSTSPKCLTPRNRINDTQSPACCAPYHGGSRGPSSPPLSTTVEYYPHSAPADVSSQVWSPSNPNQEFPQLRQSIPIIPYTSPVSRNSIPAAQPHISAAQQVQGVSVPPGRPYENQHSRDSGESTPFSYYEPYYYPSYLMPSNHFGPRGVYEPHDATTRDSWWTDQHSMENLARSKMQGEKIEDLDALNNPRAAAAASAAAAAGINNECSPAHTTFASPAYTEYDRAPIPVSFMNIPRMPATNARTNTPIPGSTVPPIDHIPTDMHDRSSDNTSVSGRNSHRGSFDSEPAPFLYAHPSISETRLCGMGKISTSVDQSGIPWLEFQYPREGTKHKYQIRCDVDDLDISQMGIQFRVDNCIYPGAMAPPEEYRGHRRNYETECNNIGWKLVFRNPILQHKRGLIQRAVDTYRNSSRNVSIRSRRARRLAKLHRLKDGNNNRT